MPHPRQADPIAAAIAALYVDGEPDWAAPLPTCGTRGGDSPCPARLELLSLVDAFRDALTQALAERRSDLG